MLRHIVAIAVFAASISAFVSTPTNAADKMTLRTVTDGVYMMENGRGSSNSTFVVTKEGVLVLDFDIRTADQVLAAIRKKTDKPVRYLVSSHSAGDHSTGAMHFQADKPIYIAHKNQVRDLFMQEGKEFARRTEERQSYKGKKLVRPTLGFEKSLTLYMGGLTFQIRHEGHGHSTGDTTIYIPQKRVFLAGDILDTEIHPGQGSSGESSYSKVSGWIKIIDNITARNLPVDTFVPGHGPVHVNRGIADLQEQKRYFVVMRNEVAKRIKQGKSPSQIYRELKKNMPKEFAHYRRSSRLRNFIKRFWHQLHDRGL
ncbi:MAG: MBL fold metallo-hydrolase [Rhodospirillales bacterium]|jgi:glyoxylase-like metal-dependent hydrolase (beta-lactamase superfamily II)|nr:MBL fold metallo-hydrolase [Rhodospirillales bacterium]MBT4005775.1 MBL fold metallo-hydrolase [Rhodospirillales bacterium]MBT5076159.1 MBL fold metallo-hydrolase [Rhodospirillales bacterium]MBT5114060.1 MBL fold metallo-hydrolase [Rhodospirillales bacterium]MBT5672588.1 MBL fold metallo-hydrolase [Rhodospirillales bacterium]